MNRQKSALAAVLTLTGLAVAFTLAFTLALALPVVAEEALPAEENSAALTEIPAEIPGAQLAAPEGESELPLEDALFGAQLQGPCEDQCWAAHVICRQQCPKKMPFFENCMEQNCWPALDACLAAC